MNNNIKNIFHRLCNYLKTIILNNVNNVNNVGKYIVFSLTMNIDLIKTKAIKIETKMKMEKKEKILKKNIQH